MFNTTTIAAATVTLIHTPAFGATAIINIDDDNNTNNAWKDVELKSNPPPPPPPLPLALDELGLEWECVDRFAVVARDLDRFEYPARARSSSRRSSTSWAASLSERPREREDLGGDVEEDGWDSLRFSSPSSHPNTLAPKVDTPATRQRACRLAPRPSHTGLRATLTE
ncbi:hypothetical protein NMY22_g4728 [Coprinellus aureogranulatus]|nr:hypothetical protein NMY22_g4728 [Coprinellus aureogranulatus]